MSPSLQLSAVRRRARTAAPGVTEPAPAGPAPDWSERTLELLSALSPRERAFTEWFASGLSAAEAYRRAAGRSQGSAQAGARQQAFKLRNRPRVRAAVGACLSDRNCAARFDRESLLGRLYDLILRCEDSDHPRDKATLLAALYAAAKLQGFLPARQPSPPPPAARATTATDASRRLDELIGKAEQAIAGPAARPRAEAGDDAHAGGRPPEPWAGGPGHRPEPVGAPGPASPR